jgi:hypothetical protein
VPADTRNMLEQPLSQRLREIREGRTAPVEAEPALEAVPEALPEPPPRTPLGRLLVEKGALSEADLGLALAHQREDGRPLGQILLEMGAVTPSDLARTLTEQHGFDFTASLRRRLSAVESPEEAEAPDEGPDEGAPGGERYLVREPGLGDPLHVADSFLDAADAAFELIEDRDPERLEIVRARDGGLEHLWSYNRADTELAAADGYENEPPLAS